MKRHIVLPIFMLIASISFTAVSVADEEMDKEYRNGLMSIFQAHVDSIELILSGNTKYGTNVLRHSMALQNSGEFLDHGFLDETKKPVKVDSANTDEEPKSFYFYVQESQHARDNLVETVRKEAGGTNNGAISTALDQVKESCDKCHQQFRIST